MGVGLDDRRFTLWEKANEFSEVFSIRRTGVAEYSDYGRRWRISPDTRWLRAISGVQRFRITWVGPSGRHCALCGRALDWVICTQRMPRQD
jgi:hypothetical protein